MAIFDIFKKKKEKKRPIEKKKEVKKPPEVKLEKIQKEKEIKEERHPVRGVRKPQKISEIAFRILKEPHITEKATELAKVNQYIFKVNPKANKNEVKKAIESLYGVDVVSVKIINIPKKRRRLGRIRGFKKGYKKAIIKIKEGQKIEVIPR